MRETNRPVSSRSPGSVVRHRFEPARRVTRPPLLHFTETRLDVGALRHEQRPLRVARVQEREAAFEFDAGRRYGGVIAGGHQQ